MQFVRGTWEPWSGGLLELDGWATDGSGAGLVGIDKYRLTLSRDSKTLGGRSECLAAAGNGSGWEAELLLTRQGGLVAADADGFYTSFQD